MKKLLIATTLLISFHSFAQSSDAKMEEAKKKMDYGDKQLFQRDTCRKPIEYLETRYPEFTKSQLEEMKAKCK